MNIWFTSDPHYSHTNVIRYCNRPYTKNVEALLRYNLTDISDEMIREATQKDVLEMNEDMVSRYNSVVKSDDTIYFLGDFSLSFQSVAIYLPRLNGHKHLISGNHDFCSRLHKKGRKDQPKWIKAYLDMGFESVQEFLHLDIEGEQVLLHHMPYRYQGEDHHDEKYHLDRPEDNGLWLLHGHVHEKWLKRGRMINVGVDVNNFTPVSLDKIIELMSS